jgi:dihydroxyacetone kinase-like protein
VTHEVVTVDRLDAWVRRFGDLVADQRTYLTDLDSAIGDADHGINLDRGMRAVCDRLDEARPSTADELFKLVGMTLVSSVGGASGPLYGTFFLRLGTACGRREAVSLDDLAKAFRAAVEGVVARGRPELGDKTMYDSLEPALEALDAAIEARSSIGDAFMGAWRAASEGRDATIPMVARKGRASYLGERSAGHQDPGATSAAMLFEAASTVFASPS